MPWIESYSYAYPINGNQTEEESMCRNCSPGMFECHYSNPPKWVSIVDCWYSSNYISTTKSTGSIKAVLPEIRIDWRTLHFSIHLSAPAPGEDPALSVMQVGEEWGGLWGCCLCRRRLAQPCRPSIEFLDVSSIKNPGPVGIRGWTLGFAVNKKPMLMLSLKIYCFFGIGGGV